MPEIALYDRIGLFAGMAAVDETPDSSSSIEVQGHVYVWNYRNAQFREVGQTIVGRLVGQGHYSAPKGA